MIVATATVVPRSIRDTNELDYNNKTPTLQSNDAFFPTIQVNHVPIRKRPVRMTP